MKRLRVSRDWRPTWKAFWLVLAGLWPTYLLLMLLSNVLTGGGVEVPPDSWFDWLAMIVVAVMYLVLVALFAWLVYKPAPPQPHPFGKREFWLTAAIFMLFIITSALVLDALGVWSALTPTYNSLGAFTLVVPAAVVWVVMQVWKWLPPGAWYKRPTITAGFTCGFWLAIIIPVCAAIIWMLVTH